MHIHRSAQVRQFTVVPNVLVQDRRLSYTARGLLADLLSRPDGWREDARLMADTSPQGRAAIRKALKELIAAGYYRVVKVRKPDGTIHSEIHVYDTPQPVAPGTTRPGSGGPPVDTAGVLTKNRGKEPSLPALPVEPAAPAPPAPEPDERTRSAVATLFRVLRPEPRLRLGAAEAGELAPLVSQWLERGGTTAELAQALLPGLPAAVHSPAGFLRNRLHRKMPPERIAEPAAGPPAGAPGAPPRAQYAECTRCHDPVPRPGICRPCSGLGSRTVAVGGGAGVTRSGAARVRAALHAARATCAAPG
jgi:hypothetical protein